MKNQISTSRTLFFAVLTIGIITTIAFLLKPSTQPDCGQLYPLNGQLPYNLTNISMTEEMEDYGYDVMYAVEENCYYDPDTLATPCRCIAKVDTIFFDGTPWTQAGLDTQARLYWKYAYGSPFVDPSGSLPVTVSDFGIAVPAGAGVPEMTVRNGLAFALDLPEPPYDGFVLDMLAPNASGLCVVGVLVGGAPNGGLFGTMW